MSYLNQTNPREYLTFQQIQRKYQAQQSHKSDLFYILLNEQRQNAGAASSVKMQQTQEEVMIQQQVQQHQGCRCSKIGCLKLYCECFANGKKCGGHCSCSCCHNKHGNQGEIYQAQMLTNLRHPGHFKGVPAAIPTRRCTCKKSMCQKRYCQCYSAGLKCSQYCQCKDCHNGQPHNHGDDQFMNLNDLSMEIQAQA